LPRKPGGNKRRIAGRKKAFPGHFNHGEKSKATQRGRGMVLEVNTDMERQWGGSRGVLSLVSAWGSPGRQ